MHGWKFKISENLNYRKSEFKTCCMPPKYQKKKQSKWSNTFILTETKSNKLFSSAEFSILSSGINLKNFTHGNGLFIDLRRSKETIDSLVTYFGKTKDSVFQKRVPGKMFLRSGPVKNLPNKIIFYGCSHLCWWLILEFVNQEHISTAV